MSEKLQKLLATVGLGSRRELEKWISAGRVSVNGSTAKLGDRAEADDRILVDGRPIKIVTDDSPRVLMYSKPEGEVSTTTDPEGRPTVFDGLPRLSRGRWIAIGRLDINTSGLLLFTTHGELANRLMHPSYEVKREYMVRIHGEVNEAMIARLTEGVILEDGVAKFQTVKAQHARSNDEHISSNQWFRVILAEGRTREVRRLWESQGVEVNRLKRISYGPIELPSFVRRSEFIELDPKQVISLFRAVSLKPPKFSEKNVLKDIRERKEKKLRARGNPYK
ncbi:MAG: pseudouridine synthase [Porticoccaceae bacterium]|jgi:23S rRNA pseudouridine2605 synthase|nr:23S rRNA pseudouridylate synthase B [Porticoccaceae bacterium]MAY69150.1 23S rRNA pseudouridylate synthase B [Porticoccaceae bacterium]MDA7849962.1 pseudouridine synthase [Porticoccaceae bacterium]MDB2382725.1 pseudouridine synthase [Porticoccaceae bacterium]MDB2566172.1 pseudouridine synthase [Porticoccaceae bacterium]|tara:strand:- start:7598 stop:8434 length:837 start_codon:yes stop_codon:yes gene_type:complete